MQLTGERQDMRGENQDQNTIVRDSIGERREMSSQCFRIQLYGSFILLDNMFSILYLLRFPKVTHCLINTVDIGSCIEDFAGTAVMSL